MSDPIRSLISSLVQRVKFFSRFGFDAFYGNRNYLQVLGYKENLTLDDYRARYERGGITESLVEFFPDHIWNGRIAITETDDPHDKTEFELSCEKLIERLSLESRFKQADVLANLGEYSVLLIGAPGELSEPIISLKSADNIAYLMPIPQDRAKIHKLVGESGTDEERKKARFDPRFGQPESYNVNFKTTIGGGHSNAIVHWSRIVHIAYSPLGDDIYAPPYLRSIWNYLDDLMKLTGGGSEAAWKKMAPPTLFDLDKDMEKPDDSELDQLEEDIEELVHNQSQYIKTRGITPRPVQSTVYNFSPNASFVISMILATKRIPQRIFMGSERGELASSQDRNNLNDTVSLFRLLTREPRVREFVNRLISFGAIPKPSNKDGKFKIVWPEEEELSETEKADFASKVGNVWTLDEKRDRLWGMKPMEKDQIENDSGTVKKDDDTEVPDDPKPDDDDDTEISDDELPDDVDIEVED